LGGYEKAPKPPNDGAPQYVCRVPYKGGVQPGKLLKGLCNIGWGGGELVFTEYEVAVSAGGAWGPPTADYRGALIGGSENGGPLYVCRVPNYQYEKTGSGLGLPGFHEFEERGTHLGKVVAGSCHFGFGGKEKDAYPFEVYHAGSAAPPVAGVATTPPAEPPGPGMVITFTSGTGRVGGSVTATNAKTGQSATKAIGSDENEYVCAARLYDAAMQAGLQARVTGTSVKIWGAGNVVHVIGALNTLRNF